MILRFSKREWVTSSPIPNSSNLKVNLKFEFFLEKIANFKLNSSFKFLFPLGTKIDNRTEILLIKESIMAYSLKLRSTLRLCTRVKKFYSAANFVGLLCKA